MPSASAAFCLPSPILHTFLLCPAHPTIVTALIHLKFPHFQISDLPLSQSYPVSLSQYSCTHFPAMSCFPRSLLSPSFFSLLFTHSSHCLTPSPTNPQTSVVPSTPPNFSNTSPFLLNVFPSRLLLASV